MNKTIEVGQSVYVIRFPSWKGDTPEDIGEFKVIGVTDTLFYAVPTDGCKALAFGLHSGEFKSRTGAYRKAFTDPMSYSKMMSELQVRDKIRRWIHKNVFRLNSHQLQEVSRLIETMLTEGDADLKEMNKNE